ncbi:caspase family protein [Bradyrhizobium sp. BR 1433]|uniref:caspase family protein n=1 Tax=Bradyrhizobium sp. BR 1433 TaxID=3447967 RepID=UPI003EE65B18
MDLRQLRISRRTIAVCVAVAGTVSLAIGAHAALNKRTLDVAKETVAGGDKVAPTELTGSIPAGTSRLALIIGNGHYPDAAAPLAQPINDARTLSSALRREGFDVDVVEDATKDDMFRAVERMKAKIRPDTVVMLFFGGYGVQVGRESYMIPVDATIWKEADVKRTGVSVESVLDAMKERGAKAKLVVLDASRRNPYERRFRAFSHGLAPISPPENTIVLSSATPGKVADDSKAPNSVLVSELLNNLNAQAGAESAFNKTRVAISRASEGEQVPSVSSSLLEDIKLGG